MRSDAVKTGTQQAPHRSLFNALGMTKEEMERPLVGIVCSYNEIVPGHMNLDKIAQAVKLGVAMAGGTPVMFPAIAVCDGIAMGHIGMKYSLVTRDLIADSTEAMALAHQFDALVMIPNCDKNVPGLLMAAARINVPTLYILSNYSQFMLDQTRPGKMPFLKNMDGVIFSCEVQQIKPEADIYETLLSRFGLKPEESVFLDDRPENCEAARKLGIHAIEFHDLKQAAKELEKLGVK